MIKAEINKQLMVYVHNEVGTLSEITSIISSADINLVALCAYEIANQVAIMFVTDDNNEAKRLLELNNISVQEEEVILLSLDNKPGALKSITDKVAECAIDLTLIYGGVDKDTSVSQLVLISKQNLDLMMIIKTEMERS